jgi:hypothetical protein
MTEARKRGSVAARAVLASWMDAWTLGEWEAMRAFSQRSWVAGNGDPDRYGEVLAWFAAHYGHRHLESWKLTGECTKVTATEGRVFHAGDALRVLRVRAVIREEPVDADRQTVVVKPRTQVDLELIVVREDIDGKPVADEREADGAWGVNPVSALRIKNAAVAR